MESITSSNLGSFRTYYSIEPCDEKFHEDKCLDISYVPCLRAELLKAKLRIKELEAEKFGSRIYIRDQRNEIEETTDPYVDSLKKKLSKEKDENSMLRKKILELESSTNRLRRERNAMEEVCEELVTRIDEMKMNAERMSEETEEERQMMQMAEMWREERVRVKFNDAKLALQEKYEVMDFLVVELEKCLEMVREGGVEEVRLRRCEGLIKMARSMKGFEGDQIEFKRFKVLSDEDNS